MHVDRDCYIHIISLSLMLATPNAVADPEFDLGGGLIIIIYRLTWKRDKNVFVWFYVTLRQPN